MPTIRKTTKATMAAAAAMPSIPKEIIDQFVTRLDERTGGQLPLIPEPSPSAGEKDDEAAWKALAWRDDARASFPRRNLRRLCPARRPDSGADVFVHEV